MAARWSSLWDGCRQPPRAAYPQLKRPGPGLAAYLALLRLGVTVPRLLPGARWALTPPFHPYPWNQGRSVLCGPFRRLTAPRRYLAVCPVELGLSSARHSNRRTATITPYRLPRERYRSRKGRGKPQRASRLNRRTRLSGGSRPEVLVPAASPGS